MALAPFSVTLTKGSEGLLAHTVYMPERIRKVNPFLRSITAHRAVKALSDAGKGLLQKCNQIISRGRPLLRGKLKLSVEGFEIIANRIHGGEIAQISPIIKRVTSNFYGISLIGFYAAQRISTVLLDEKRINSADKEPCFVQRFCNRFIVTPRMFHHDTGFTVNSLQLLSQRSNSDSKAAGRILGIPLIIAPKPAVSSSATQSFEKKRNSSALFAREINLVTQPSFDCEQGINSQVQTACSNADAIFPVLGIVSCRNERFSLSRKTHVPLWNEPRISHVRLL